MAAVRGHCTIRCLLGGINIRVAVLLAALLLGASESSANTLLVPDQYSTIQAAIDASTNGDVVEIADDVYSGPGNKDLDFGGRAITVRSASNDPALCIIDCGTNGRGFHFHNGEGADSVVQGLTIRNGRAQVGGGVYCDLFTSPTLLNCTITNCAATQTGGGGLHCDHALPTLSHCTLSDNSADDLPVPAGGGGGGAYFVNGSNAIFTYCTITGNTGDIGAGVFCHQRSMPRFYRCTITENIATYGGGGVYSAIDSFPKFYWCTIDGNSADRGGGIVIDLAYGTFRNCMIRGNMATTDGGALLCQFESTPTLFNCLVTGNTAGRNGGALFTDYLDDPELTNCTLADNTAQSGGAIYCDSEGSATLLNTVVWDNTPDAIHVTDTNPNVTYCDIAGGWAGTGNINQDPLFATGPSGDYYLSQIAAGQALDSPCVNAGSDTAANLGLGTQTTRTDQVTDTGGVDMGYHYAVTRPFLMGSDVKRESSRNIGGIGRRIQRH